MARYGDSNPDGGRTDSDSCTRYAETGTHDVSRGGQQSETYSHFLKTGEPGRLFGGVVTNDLPFVGPPMAAMTDAAKLKYATRYPDRAAYVGIGPFSSSPSVSVPGTGSGVSDPVIPFFPGAYGGEGEPKTGLYLGVGLLAAALYISRRK